MKLPKIEHVAISKVHSNPNNPRKISAKDFKALVKSLRENPDLFNARPVLCSDRTGKLVALGGNMRLAAARELKYAKVPIIRFSKLTEEQERAIVVKDNGSFGEWDQELLAELYADLPLSEMGVDLPAGLLRKLDVPPSLAEAFQQGTELVAVGELKPHPRNYREHPDDQIAEIIASIQAHGIYRNAVIARDGTILAGHGFIKAAKKIGMDVIPAVRLNVDANDPRALKVLIGDNEFSHLAEVDDRLLTELLKEIKEVDPAGLVGTGYDDKMLAALAFITRPADEIADHQEAAQWAGMPEYEALGKILAIVIRFRTREDREEFGRLHKLEIDHKGETTWSTRWPFTERRDMSSLRFEEKSAEKPA